MELVKKNTPSEMRHRRAPIELQPSAPALLSSLQGVAYGCNYEQLVEGDCPLSI